MNLKQRHVRPDRLHRTKRAVFPALALCTGLVMMTACGGDDSSESSAFDDAASSPAASAAPAAAEEAAPAETAAPALDGEVFVAGESDGDLAIPDASVPAQVDSGETGSAAFPVIPIPGRSIAYTAGLSMETPDVSGTVTRIGEIVVGAGGNIFDANVDLSVPGQERGTLTVKVPPSGLGSAIQQIGNLGTVTGRSQDAEDVTAQVIDLDARILTAQASVDRVRDFLAKTTNVSELAGVEAELTVRETELEQLRAQQRGLRERVGLATLTIELFSPAQAPAPEPPPIVEQPTTVASAFKSGGRAMWSVLRGIAIAAAAIAPMLVLIVPALMVMWFAARRYRRRHARKVRPTAAPFTPLAAMHPPVAPPTPGEVGENTPVPQP